MKTTFRARVLRLLAHAHSLRTAIAARSARTQGSPQLFRAADGGFVRVGEQGAIPEVQRRQCAASNEPSYAVSCRGDAARPRGNCRSSFCLVQGGRSDNRPRCPSRSGVRWRAAAVAALTGCLSACGGGGGSASTSASPAHPVSNSGAQIAAITTVAYSDGSKGPSFRLAVVDQGSIIKYGSAPNNEDQEAWKTTLSRARVRYRNLYQTRHTFASMMLSAGEREIWVANQMGHSDTTSIRRNYGRWIPSSDPHAGDRAVALFAAENAGNEKLAKPG